MRSALAAGLMGIGGIFVSFGAVVAVIEFFSRHNDWRVQLPAMTSLALGTIVIGAVMFVAGERSVNGCCGESVTCQEPLKVVEPQHCSFSFRETIEYSFEGVGLRSKEVMPIQRCQDCFIRQPALACARRWRI